MILIDADALIERINEEKKDIVNVGYLAGLCSAEECVNDTPTVEQSRWIPCSERLPEKKGYYLVTRKNPKGHVTRVRFNPEQVKRGVYNSPWGNGDCDILAWMPLPRPYDSQENEE